MNTLKRLTVLLPICAALIAGTACGDDTESRTAADTSALQPGNYRTTPRSPEEVRTPENIDIQEALRLGATVPMIMNANPRLVFNRVEAARKALTQKHPPQYTSFDFTSTMPGFVVGWETVGQRRENSVHGRTVELTILRFAEPHQAAHAAKFLSDADLRGSYPPTGTIAIPGYPTAIGHITKSGSISAWVPQGTFMVKAWVGAGVDIPPDPAGLADFLETILDNQFTSLQNYEPTPPDKTDKLPVDRDGLLQYTLVGSEFTAEAVMTPDVALNFLQRPDLVKRAFEDAHVDLAVHAATKIYRAVDPAAADRLKAFFASQQASGVQPVDAPPGLPTAHCTADPEETSSHSCIFTTGRYTVVIEGSNQIQDLHQQVAAQYLLLDQASK